MAGCPQGRRKKLLVLDLNGFLVDRVRLNGDGGTAPQPSTKCDLYEGGCSVYFRAHMREFIDWCLETFELGVWTSAKRHNVHALLDSVFGARKTQLCFIWDQSNCTTVGALRHPDCSYKPIFLKELSKLWTHGCAAGPFDPNNTILLDDTVYKTAANPAHTSIHPREWKAARVDEAPPAHGDDGLSQNSDLRRLLALVAAAPDVRDALARAAPSFPSLLPSASERLRLIGSIPGLLEHVDALHKQVRQQGAQRKKRSRAESEAVEASAGKGANVLKARKLAPKPLPRPPLPAAQRTAKAPVRDVPEAPPAVRAAAVAGHVDDNLHAHAQLRTRHRVYVPPGRAQSTRLKLYSLPRRQ